MAKVYLGLGSNVGDRAGYLTKARDLILTHVGEIILESSIMETESWGFKSDPFLNQVILIETFLEPLDLLTQLNLIEKELGRYEKTVRSENHIEYHDRTIDIDILIYEELKWESEQLTLPHPNMNKRDFVMIPLAEIADPELITKIKTGNF
jgi:2-amino-4-hydroxy-6-hydroxymethyldihydropteridine diphosphokinase